MNKSVPVRRCSVFAVFKLHCCILEARPSKKVISDEKDGKLFESNYPKSMGGILGKWSILMINGDIHRTLRSLAVNFMNAVRIRSHILRNVDFHVRQGLNDLPVNSPFSATEMAKKIIFHVMSSQILSMDPGEPDNDWLRKEFITFMRGLTSYFPINLPGTAYGKAIKSRSNILKFLLKKMNERRATGVKEDDFLEIVLQSNLSDDQKLDLLLGFLLGSYETTSTAISLVIFFLEACPKAVAQLREEHLGITRKKQQARASSDLNWDDYKQMNFTQCVINESLRLGNIVRHVHRKALQDITYKGFFIPAGWKVLPTFAPIHLDPTLYKDPEKFDPWRWQNEKAGEKFTPFSAGSRVCAGMEVARLEIAVMTDHLVLNYRWELAEPDAVTAYPNLEFHKELPIKVHPYCCTDNKNDHMSTQD